MIDTDLHFIDESKQDYEDKRIAYYGVHDLQLFHDRTPDYMRKKKDGIIPSGKNEAFRFGTMAHTMILEGEDAFFREYEVTDGPINEKTGKPYGKTSMAYLKWLANRDREICSTKDYKTLLHMYDSVRDHPIASGLLSEGAPEVTIRGKIGGLPWQSRIDWLNKTTVVDFKTTKNLDTFKDDIDEYGYRLQMYAYSIVCSYASNSQDFGKPTYIIATEKVEPYRTGVFRVYCNRKKQGQELVEKISNVAKCHNSNEWPDTYQEIQEIK